MSDLCHRSDIGVCRGGDCAIDLRRHVILACAEAVSVWVTCVAVLCWRLQRGCLCDCSVSPHLY